MCRTLLRLRSANAAVADKTSTHTATQATKKLMQMLMRAAWVEDAFRSVARLCQTATRRTQGDKARLEALLHSLELSSVSLSPVQVDVAFHGPEGTPCLRRSCYSPQIRLWDMNLSPRLSARNFRAPNLARSAARSDCIHARARKQADHTWGEMHGLAGLQSGLPV